MMSDAFMRNMLKKRECTEYILQVVMDQENLSVAAQTIQKDYKNLYGRSAILDCVVRDTQNRRYDIEIQQDNEGGSSKRARYHSGLMDMHTLSYLLPVMIRWAEEFRHIILTEKSEKHRMILTTARTLSILILKYRMIRSWAG